MNGFVWGAAAIGGLWWLSKKKAQRARSACGCKNTALIEAGNPRGGTDCTGTWWQRLHGADLMHPQFKNYAGVSMDPSSTDKVALAVALKIGWNGDATA